jgi:hypothetical protein
MRFLLHPSIAVVATVLLGCVSDDPTTPLQKPSTDAAAGDTCAKLIDQAPQTVDQPCDTGVPLPSSFGYGTIEPGTYTLTHVAHQSASCNASVRRGVLQIVQSGPELLFREHRGLVAGTDEFDFAWIVTGAGTSAGTIKTTMTCGLAAGVGNPFEYSARPASGAGSATISFLVGAGTVLTYSKR